MTALTVYFFFLLLTFPDSKVLTIMFISHFLATREIKADQGTQANERREIEDKEDVLCHVAARPNSKLQIIS